MLQLNTALIVLPFLFSFITGESSIQAPVQMRLGVSIKYPRRINLINLSFVSIIVPPQISVNNTKITVEEGDGVVIQCSATGTPVPNVTWFNNRQEVLGYGKGNASLFFKNSTRKENGTYVCIAKNSAGKKEKESIVNVVCKY